MFACFFGFICLVSLAAGQFADTCATLRQCLETANNCEQQKANLTANQPITPRFLEATRKRLNLNNCSDASVTQILKTAAEGRVKTAQRHQRVARCIAGDLSSFPNCPALPLPSANSLSRNCATKVKRQTRPAQTPKCDKERCRDYFCGCPEANLCHECYELSELHDEIHLIQLTHKLQLARCSVVVALRDETIPDQDDSLSSALVG